MALWNGRFDKASDAAGIAFTGSVDCDRRLYPYDIRGSIAHARMLARTGIIPQGDADAIVDGLNRIRARMDAGTFAFRPELEDIHMNIEAALIDDLGDVGARLHTGRSRNDQIATDERLYLRDAIDDITSQLRDFQRALVTLGHRERTVVMPGFTHLQHAQPVLFAHHLLAYVEMLERDCRRLQDCRRRMNVLPLGAGALAGSTLPLDREYVAEQLGFDGVAANSMDAVADRDYLVEFLSALSILAMHISRFSEDIVLWTSTEFGYLELDDACCTGSSLMPQKKNPDLAELARGKSGRVFGSLVALLTVLKGLPLTYNRDLQEDKEGVFDAADTVSAALAALTPMMESASVNREAMARAAEDPQLMATDLAEWLVRRGVPFREAHHQVGRFVAACAKRQISLADASLEMMQQHLPAATAECQALFSAQRSVAARDIPGGTAPRRVEEQLHRWQAFLEP